MIRLMAMVGALMVGGCISVLPQSPPPPPRFAIPAAKPVVTEEARAWTLSVDDPSSTRAIDTARIARSEGELQYRYYADGVWTDRAPRLFGSALVRSFENTGALPGAGSRAGQPIADFILLTDIRTFEVRADSGVLEARVEVYARLSSVRGKVYAARLFNHTAPVKSDKAPAAASGIAQNAALVLDEIVTWASAEADRAYAKNPIVAPISK